MADASRDNNRIPTLLGVSNADNTTPVRVWADPTTHALLISGNITASPASVGTTGAAVPASADYIAASKAGTLTGLLMGSQTTANSLAVVLASDQVSIPVTIAGTQSVNVAQINGVTTLMGNGATGTGSQRVTLSNDNTAIANWGQGATGAAVPSGAIYNAGIAQTSLPSAATAGNLTGMMVDKYQRQVVIPQGMRDLVLPMTQLTLTSTTTETTLISSVASTFLDILSITIVNTSATGTQVDFRDSTGGTVRWTAYAPPTDMRGIVFQVPLPQNTVNNNWTAKCGTSVASIIITGEYISNK